MSTNIICPECNTKVMTYDDKGTMPLRSKCLVCRKLITYFPVTKEIKIGLLPVRQSSSGKRFY